MTRCQKMTACQNLTRCQKLTNCQKMTACQNFQIVQLCPVWFDPRLPGVHVYTYVWVFFWVFFQETVYYENLGFFVWGCPCTTVFLGFFVSTIIGIVRYECYS